MTQHNVDELEFVVRRAAERGARSVQVHPLTLNGRAQLLLSESRPDGVELSAALAEAFRLGAELGVAVHVDALTVDSLGSLRAAALSSLARERLASGQGDRLAAVYERT